MDRLSDWYRYVDELSRPARRSSDEEASTEPWRPWMPPPAGDPEEITEIVRPDQVPDLALGLGGRDRPTPLQPAEPRYEDPTLDDELQPIREWDVPSFQAPSFDLSIPLFGQAPVKQAMEPVPAGGAARTAAADSPPRRRAGTAEAGDAAAEDPAGRPAADTRPADTSQADNELLLDAESYRERLALMRGPDVAQNSYKSPFRETREELVQRLLDPPLTLEDAARLLGVCPTTVRRYTNRGHLRHFRTSGNQRRFRLSDVLEFLETRSSEIAADAEADEKKLRGE